MATFMVSAVSLIEEIVRTAVGFFLKLILSIALCLVSLAFSWPLHLLGSPNIPFNNQWTFIPPLHLSGQLFPTKISSGLSLRRLRACRYQDSTMNYVRFAAVTVSAFLHSLPDECLVFSKQPISLPARNDKEPYVFHVVAFWSRPLSFCRCYRLH